MRTLTVLGSTGSIGTNTLDVVRRNRHLYQVYALVAGQNVDLLAAQILEFRPKVAVVATIRRRRRVSPAGWPTSGLPRAEWPELLPGRAARVAGRDRARSRYGDFRDRRRRRPGSHLRGGLPRKARRAGQ